MKRIIFFLGAGASAADGAPVMSRYLEEIERCFGDRAEWGEIEQVLMKCPCPVPHSSKYPTINDFLTYLDESIARKNLVNGQDPEKIRFLLLRLMFGRLTEQERPRSRFTWPNHMDVASGPDLDSDRDSRAARQHSNNSRYIDYECPDIPPPLNTDYVESAEVMDRTPVIGQDSTKDTPPIISSSCYVGHLCSNELTELVPERPEDARNPANHRLAKLAVDWGVEAVISTNYDLIFDQALEDLNVKFDYCVGCSESHEFQRRVRLLKLHGSVNWILCRDCGYVDIWKDSYPTQTLWADKPISRSCRRCSGTKWTDALVTPTRRRSYEYLDLGLKPVWDAAMAELRKADVVLFIGYSLPCEDKDVFDLLCNGIRKEANVLVVDPNENTINRYKGALGAHRVTPLLKPLSADLWDASEVKSILERLGIGGGDDVSGLTCWC